MGTSVNLSASSGGGDGYRGELPLERELERPIEIDARELRSCHPMFALRLRMFVDWHRAAGNEVLLRPPNRAAVAERLAAMAVVPDDMSSMEPGTGSAIMLSLRKLATYHDVEDAATDATSVLAGQAADLAVWGDAMHMAIGELCDNALLHGALGNDLGAYVAADRTDNERGRESASP